MNKFSRRPASNKMFTIGATVDMKSQQSIPVRELADMIDKALEAHKIGDLTVRKDEFYELVAIKGNFHCNCIFRQIFEMNILSKLFPRWSVCLF